VFLDNLIFSIPLSLSVGDQSLVLSNQPDKLLSTELTFVLIYFGFFLKKIMWESVERIGNRKYGSLSFWGSIL
jgi:hypothetical protein